MVFGFTYYDEAFALGWLAVVLKHNSIRWSDQKSLIVNCSQVLFCLYFMSNAIYGLSSRGSVFSQDGIRQLRWVVYFFVLLVLFRTVDKKQVLFKNKLKNKSQKIFFVRWGLSFAILYLLIGLTSRFFSGSAAYSQFAQSYSKMTGWKQIFGIFGNTSYVVVTVIFLATVALKLIWEADSKLRYYGLSLFLILFAGQALNLSRYGTLSILILAVTFSLESAIRRRITPLVISLLPLLVLVFVGFTAISEANVMDAACEIPIVNVCWRTESAKYAHMQQDAEPLGQRGTILADSVQVFSSRASQGNLSALIGSGYRAPHINNQNAPLPIYGVNGLLLDSGLIGLLLFLALSLLTIVRVFLTEKSRALLGLTCLFLMMGSLMIVNSLDILLLFALAGSPTLFLFLDDLFVSEAVKLRK